jgi:hypothetical protein
MGGRGHKKHLTLLKEAFLQRACAYPSGELPLPLFIELPRAMPSRKLGLRSRANFLGGPASLDTSPYGGFIGVLLGYPSTTYSYKG